MTTDGGNPVFEEEGFQVFLDTEGIWTVKDRRGQTVGRFKKQQWPEAQVRAVVICVRKNMVRAYEEGVIAGELRALNRLREALLLEPLTEV